MQQYYKLDVILTILSKWQKWGSGSLNVPVFNVSEQLHGGISMQIQHFLQSLDSFHPTALSLVTDSTKGSLASLTELLLYSCFGIPMVWVSQTPGQKCVAK